MIKEKHLAPGRSLLHAVSVPRWSSVGVFQPKREWWPCLVIGFVPEVKRRHAKKEAPVLGWEVAVLWYGDICRVMPYWRTIQNVRINPGAHDWKPADW